ncbi:unnamed protein product, partial [marine sediment metagenome]
NKLDGIEALAVALATVKADTDIADAITKKHTQNSDTDLDATFEATFVKKVDTVNVLSDITSAGADIESAVSLKHAIQHAIDSASDHTSTITQNNLIDADANGLPDDSGLAVSDVLDAVNKRNKVNTFTVGATGCDYTTIQAALNAQNSGGELFVVYPGTYTDDTIAFTANNQSIQGVGEQCCVLVTTADANIVDFGAYTNVCIHDVKITLTAPDSNVDMIIGTTGDLKLRHCDLEVTVGDVVDSIAQPSAIQVTGAGNVDVWFGSLTYNSTNSY